MARGYFNLYIEWKIYICGKMGIERVLLFVNRGWKFDRFCYWNNCLNLL